MKKRNSKIMALLLVAVMAASTIGCGAGEKPAAAEPAAEIGGETASAGTNEGGSASDSTGYADTLTIDEMCIRDRL